MNLNFLRLNISFSVIFRNRTCQESTKNTALPQLCYLKSGCLSASSHTQNKHVWGKKKQQIKQKSAFSTCSNNEFLLSIQTQTITSSALYQMQQLLNSSEIKAKLNTHRVICTDGILKQDFKLLPDSFS